jgi:hypothetical protein
MALSFILMSSASTSPYFYIIRVLNPAQSTGVGCNLLNHSLALPVKFGFVILKSLSIFRFRTLVAMVSLFTQSLTSSWFHPHNNSSIPYRPVILQCSTSIKDYNIFCTNVFRPPSDRHSPHHLFTHICSC